MIICIALVVSLAQFKSCLAWLACFILTLEFPHFTGNIHLALDRQILWECDRHKWHLAILDIGASQWSSLTPQSSLMPVTFC